MPICFPVPMDFRVFILYLLILAGFCETWILVFGYTYCGRAWALIRWALRISKHVLLLVNIGS